VQTAERFDDVLTRPAVQMIGVGQDRSVAHCRHFFGFHSLDGTAGAHRHECGRLHRTMRRLQPAAPGPAQGIPGEDPEITRQDLLIYFLLRLHPIPSAYRTAAESDGGRKNRLG
jgi:hypothetical protein